MLPPLGDYCISAGSTTQCLRHSHLHQWCKCGGSFAQRAARTKGLTTQEASQAAVGVMPTSPLCSNMCHDADEEKKSGQDGAGCNEPPPTIHCWYDEKKRTNQDKAGINEPPSIIQMSNGCRSSFTLCSPEHQGRRGSFSGCAMDSTEVTSPNAHRSHQGRLMSIPDLAHGTRCALARPVHFVVIRVGGAPSWVSPRAAFLKPHATLGERVAFMQETEGWLATDEWSFAANRINQAATHYRILPVAIYFQESDEFAFDHDQFQTSNTGISLLPILYGAHWIGVEIDRQHDTPEIAILQCAEAQQNHIETFICQLIHIPAHRLVINHWANATPPGMCGWSIMWRWISLSHTQPVFARTLQDFHSLSDDRKRIVLRALSKSAHAWEKTGSDRILQQVAHTVRHSFLMHLFAFNTGVFTRLDANATCAAGQPLAVFESHAPAPGEPHQVSIATQTTSHESEPTHMHTQYKLRSPSFPKKMKIL